MQKGWRSPAALLVAVIALRSASFVFDVLNIDEAHFALVGRALLHGGLPYVDAADIKPPFTYLPFALGELFGRFSLLPVHLFAVPWLFATCLVVRAAARRWTGSEDAGWAAAWIALAASLCEVPSVNAELLMNLPIALALLCAVRSLESDGRFDLLAGACVGAASLFKHQAAILGVGLFLGVLLRGRRRVSGSLLLLAGFAAPWALVYGFYAARGHTAELVDWVFLRNFFYAHSASAGAALPRFALSTATSIGVAAVPWALAVRETLRRSPGAPEPFRSVTLVSLWLAWLPVSAGGRFYEHYYLQFAPMLALAAAPGLAALVNAPLPRLRRSALAALSVLPPIGYLGFTFAKGFAGAYPAQDKRVVEVSRWLDQNSRPGESLFVWGDTTQLYYLSGRWPGTRYLNCAVAVGNFDPSHLPESFDVTPYVSARDVDAAVADLERNRVDLIADTSAAPLHDWDRFPLGKVSALAGYVEAHYRLLGAPEGVKVYRRR